MNTCKTQHAIAALKLRVISDFYAMGAVWFDTTPLTQHGQNAYRHTLINYSVYGLTCMVCVFFGFPIVSCSLITT